MSLFRTNNASSCQKGGGNIGYTPLIKAIKLRDVQEVRRLLEVEHVDPNEKDGIEKWSPMKWATYVYQYSLDRNEPDNSTRMQDIVALLATYGARNDFDSMTSEDSYDFSPLINEEGNESDEEYVRSTSGGKRKRKTRKMRKISKSKKSKKTIKSRKGKKSHKKTKKSTTKKRKHMKK
jgi:hypothetical protein